MLNFKLEQMLVELMKTLTHEEQSCLELESLILAHICPENMSQDEFKALRNDLWLDTQSAQVQYDYACKLSNNHEQQKIKWLTQAAEKKHNDAQRVLASLYDEKQDYKHAVFWYKAAAKEGCKIAKNNLGVCYRDGLGIEKDDQKAFQLYTESANENHSFAQCNLGRCYEFGYGVEKNAKEAFRLYSLAANNKTMERPQSAAISVGRCYRDAIGVDRDFAKSLDWFWKAANDDKNSLAYSYIGYFYKVGAGVEQNFKTAIDMYTQGAYNDNKECKIDLGICYLQGHGVDKNVETAFDLFLKASNGDKELAASLLEKYKSK